MKRGVWCPPPGGGQRAEGMPNPLPVEGTQCGGQVGCGSVVALGTSSVGGPSQLCPSPMDRGCPRLCGCSALPVVPQSPGSPRPPAAPPPQQPPHAPTPSSQRRNNLEKPWQPRAALGMPARSCPRVPALPWPHVALWAVGRCCGGGGGHASARGMQCPSPQGTGVHTVASLGYGLVWLSRAAAVGVSRDARSPHQGTPWPQQPPLYHGQSFPGILTCLFYFAVLGWSHRGALGQFSPPTPSLLLPDQVGPWAAIPCPLAALTPWGWASQHCCWQHCTVGCCLPRSGPAPKHCNAAGLMLSHCYKGKPAPPAPKTLGSPSPPGTKLSPAHSRDRHPNPIGFTSAPTSVPHPWLWGEPGLYPGNKGEPKSPSPSLHSQYCLPNKVYSFPPRNTFPVVLCCCLKPNAFCWPLPCTFSVLWSSWCPPALLVPLTRWPKPQTLIGCDEFQSWPGITAMGKASFTATQCRR